MLRKLFLIMTLLLVGTAAKAQNTYPLPYTPYNNAAQLSGTLTAQSTNCLIANSCVWISSLPTNFNGMAVTVTAGTFSGTLTVEHSGNAGAAWTTDATISATQAMTYYADAGATDFRVRLSAVTSGSAIVSLSTSAGSGGPNLPVSGTPVAGRVPVASSPTAAAWGSVPPTSLPQFFGFAGGVYAEGLLGSGWYTDNGGGTGAIQRDSFATPDATHPNTMDFIGKTPGSSTGGGLAYCNSSTVGASCGGIQNGANIPVPGAANYTLDWIFKWQKINQSAAEVQRVTNQSCTTNTSTCSVTITSTGAGHALVAFSVSGTNGLSSVTDGGDTFVVRASSVIGGAGITVGIATANSSAGSKTTVTCNLSGNSASAWACGVYEFSATGGLVFDTAGFNGNSTSATTGAAPGLAITGSDVVVQVGFNGAGLSGIANNSNYAAGLGAASYTSASDSWGGGDAYALNALQVPPATWTYTGSGASSSVAVALVEAPLTQTTNVQICMYMPSGAASRDMCGAAGDEQDIGVRYSTPLSDTYYTAFSADNTGNVTTISTGVTPIAGDWVCIQYVSTNSGSVSFAVGQAAAGGSACNNLSSPVTINTHLPTTPLVFWFDDQTEDAYWESTVAYGLYYVPPVSSIP